MIEHACTLICWEQGCDYHEVCTANVCIPATVIAAEYRRQAETYHPFGKAYFTLHEMAIEMERFAFGDRTANPEPR
jgi:hypothetical protein